MNNTSKYTSHEITKTMFENNKDFYEDVVRKNVDIKLFESSFRKWCPRRVVAFLAFCNVGEEEEEDLVISLLETWCPNWKSQFWWFVFQNKILPRWDVKTRQKPTAN